MFRLESSSLRSYAVTIASVSTAALLTVGIEPVLHGRAPLLFFIIAVAISAAFGGIGPGLLATALGMGLAAAFFQPQLLVLEIAHSGLILFGVLGVGLSVLVGRLNQAKQELETANKKLLERSRSLAQANEELERFAYAIAHDLNTPLRSIAALTDLFVQRNIGVVDESSKECAAMIVGRVHRMQSMIKGLLDYAAVAEKPEMQLPVECNALMQRVLQDLDTAIRESGAQITIAALPAVPAIESHLHQVFSNLVSNAVKYRPSVRTPQIHISASERASDWVFCVRDNGIGIDMKYAGDIFGMFKRLHGDREYEGNGIGLALCKIVIERGGGTIWVESELGHGSRFYFTVPKGAEKRQAKFDVARVPSM
jgi:signal transduction histidine kinase